MLEVTVMPFCGAPFAGIGVAMGDDLVLFE